MIFFFFFPQGRKSGKGCYIYQPGLKSKQINTEIDDILAKYKLTPNPAVWVVISSNAVIWVTLFMKLQLTQV